MFLEKSQNEIFEIKGVAEIENNIEDDTNKYLYKLETLKRYVEMTDKFPDIEFVILNTIMVIDNSNTYLDFFSPLLDEAKNYSKYSNLSWIIFILKISKNNKTPREFKVPDYIPNYETYVWYNEYEKQGAYVILQNGKELTKVGWPE